MTIAGGQKESKQAPATNSKVHCNNVVVSLQQQLAKMATEFQQILKHHSEVSKDNFR
jgi:hypothetical protein